MTLNAPKNPNYSATVVELSQFVDLPNCDNVKHALIFGNCVIVGKDSKAGDVGLFFPVETQLLREFLANNNLFRKPEWGNIDPEKKGFFEEHGRVKCMKFRGHKSEGFFIPISCLEYLPKVADLKIGDTFDELFDHPICKKYIPHQKAKGLANTPPTAKKKKIDMFVENQFRFHFDTENLRRNIHKIQPTDIISISDKWHGTSAVFANVLVKRELPWYERLLKRLGVPVVEAEYGFAWSSRKVIKGVNGEEKNSNHYYDTDLWGAWGKKIEPWLPKGFTIYGEIVGYTDGGAQIQKGYSYECCLSGSRFMVYRVTFTNVDGKVIELNWNQMKQFCTKYGLEMVKEFWYGTAGEFPLVEVPQYKGRSINRADFQVPEGEEGLWQALFLRSVEEAYVNNKPCPYNDNKVPAEGIVVHIYRLEECEAYKLKNFDFLSRESKLLDSEELDLETAESLDN